MSQPDTEIQTFFDAWETYQQVLTNNYMFHDDIYRDVSELVTKRFTANDYRMLDLGCGNAQHLAKALTGHPPSAYVGYDLSEVALTHAKPNLEALCIECEFHQGDLLDAVKGQGPTFDLIFSSFALHHLDYMEKQDFFRAAAKRMAKDGSLLIIDVVREDGESVDRYMDSYCGWVEDAWNRIEPSDRAGICEHIRSKDHPENLQALSDLAQNAGFSPAREIDHFRWHRTLEFRLA